MSELERVLTDWLAGDDERLILRFGPLGGGRLLSGWLADWLGQRDGSASVVDLTGPAATSGRQASNGRRVILAPVVLDGAEPSATDEGRRVDADALDLEPLMRSLLGRAGLLPPLAEEIAARFSPATRLADELAAAAPSDPLAFIYEHSLLRRLAIEIAEAPTGVLELGRVLLLMRPQTVAVSDEWLTIASRLSGRTCSVRDLSRLILEWSWLFTFERRGPERYVRPKNPLSVELISGMVPTSGSEHFALYRVLRSRALDSLVGRDSSDGFVAEQLPRQAMAAFAFEDLFQDPGAVLCSDVTALVKEIERNPELVLSPGAKAVLLCAHRLAADHDRGSSLELSALRVGLRGFSTELGELLPDRPWRAEWSQAQPVNANRIIHSGTAPVLALSTARPEASVAVAGSSDGRAWLVAPYAPARCIWDRSADAGEVRDVGLHLTETGRHVAVVATSDQRVAAIDCADGRELWQDKTTHLAPLSVLSVSGPGGAALVASSGVDGLIRVSDLHRGEAVGDELVVYRHTNTGQPIEIRGLEFVTFDDRSLLIFSAVDGKIGVIDPFSGRLLGLWALGEAVLNNVAACRLNDSTLVAVGASDGAVLLADLRVRGEGVEIGEIREAARHRDAVNGVAIERLDGEPTVLSASMDGTWKATPLDPRGDGATIEGHFGPVWDIGLLHGDGNTLVATTGSDGCCRVWVAEAVRREFLALEKSTRHAGPVTTVSLRTDAADTTIWTGGVDGDVRAWSINGTVSGRALAQDDATITTLELGPIGEHDSTVLYSGTARGELYRTEGTAHNPRRQSLLGIVHDGVTCLHVTKAGRQPVLVSGGRDGRVANWHLQGDRPISSTQISKYGEVSAVTSIEGSGSEPTIVVGSQDGHLSFLAGGSMEVTWRHPFGVPIASAAALPFHRRGLIVGLADGRILSIRDVRAGGGAWAALGSHADEVTGVEAFVVGGRLVVASTGLDRYLRLWDLSTKALLQEIQLDGQGLDLATDSPRVAVATTAGASVFTFSDDPLLLAARR